MKALISGEAEFNNVKNITVTLSHVSVEEIADNQVFGGLPDQQVSCSQALENLKDRTNIGFLQNALKADAVYTVVFNSRAGLSVEGQAEITRGITAKLGTSLVVDSDNKIIGNGLYWGVKQPRSDLVKSNKASGAEKTSRTGGVGLPPVGL